MGDAMIRIDDEFLSDVAAREALLDRAFGETRFAKTSERLRAGRLPAEGLALAARDRAGRLVGTVRLWNVAAGLGRPALLLGPLAVDEAARGEGVGSALMREALHRAGGLGHRAVLLVGDAPYYGRFGFRRLDDVVMPPPTNPDRVLGFALVRGAWDGVAGPVTRFG
jgi:predicted N-acetyltransferase YhbS